MLGRKCYGRQSSWQRPNDTASSSRAPSIAREERHPGQALRTEPNHCQQVARPDDNRRRPHGTERATQHRAHDGPGGYDRRVPTATLLPLDDVLGCLRDSIPNLTRSSLHRCLTRHDISRLPESPDKASKRGKFAAVAIGYVHIDISELRLAEGKLNMFLVIDRVSKFTYVEFRSDAGKINGADFLRGVVKAFPISSTPS